MQNSIEIQHLSREEKLMVMEAIWQDLSNDDEPVESPGWHHKALQETEKQFSMGHEKVVDWQHAKKELRKRFE